MARGVIIYEGSPEAKGKALRSALKAANIATVEYWHKRFMPGHFKASASRKYGYQERTFKYTKRKRRQKGHNLPLVWTGISRFRAQMHFKATGTSERGRGALKSMPAYFYQYRGKGPNKRDELLTTTDVEDKAMAKFWGRVIGKHINGVRTLEIKRFAA